MSFSTDVAINGHGAAFQMEVSFDGFSSTTYFLSTIGHSYASTDYQPRIASVGRLQRGLTVEHNLAASTVDVTLVNTDGYFDWLVDRANAEQYVFKMKVRLYLVAYDPSTATLSRKLLGQFGCLDNPRRTPASVLLSLVDDSNIDGAEFAIAPSIKDWVTDGSSTFANNPLCKSNSTLVDSPYFFTPYEAPLQLAFGNIYVDCQKTADFDAGPISTNFDRRSLVVCVTTDTGTVTATDIEHLYLRVPNATDPISQSLDGREIPASFAKGFFPGDIWTASRSQSLTKDGRTWKIIWVDIRMRRLLGWLNIVGNWGPLTPNPPPTPQWLADPHKWDHLYGMLEFRAAGWPYSSRTYPTTALQAFGDGVRAPDIAYDLIAYYSHGLTTSNVDLTSFQNAAKVLPFFYASGVIDDTFNLTHTRSAYADESINQKFESVEMIGGRLRGVLSDLARSGSFDIVVGWDGTFKATAQVSNFTDQTSTLPSLYETRIVGEWEDKVPSPGERWAPHNRLYIQGLDGLIGPFDNASAVTAWGRKIPYTLNTKWVSPSDYSALARDPNLNLFNTAALESKIRQRISFTYGSLEVLDLDIGDYFQMALTRGGSAVLSGYFKMEQMDLLPEDMTVYVEAIWYGDLRTDLAYFLDNETYSLVATGSGGRTATVADSSTTVTFSSGSLVTDNVAAGDILVLMDSTLAEDDFTRYRCLLVDSVTDATHLVISSSDLDFGGGAAVSSWEIHRGATSYNALESSDPTHYPSGESSLYGKVADQYGEDSNGGDTAVLLDG